MFDSKNEELSCREVVELVTAYLEGVLADPDRTRFEEHVSQCEGCADYIEQMRVTLRVAAKLDEGAVSAEAHSKLMEAFRGWRRSARDGDAGQTPSP